MSYISKTLIEERLSNHAPTRPQKAEEFCNPELLLANLEQLHTTELGAQRI